jgi:glucose-6-phosphate 1-dehydrogenase
MTIQRAPDQDIIIVGATGDLSRRKLLPALYDLFVAGLLPKSGSIVGYAQRDLSDEEFRDMAREAAEKRSRTGFDEEAWRVFASRLCYVPSSVGLDQVVARCVKPDHLVYLSTPPSVFREIVEDLGRHHLESGTRIIVEKPVGHDLGSAQELEDLLHRVFDESQVFRIDHFLGKETVQNILVLRFANSVFERVWNRDAIDHVQITIAEEIGIEGRGDFYEETGAIRDIIQNHAFQVLSLLTMEPPASFSAYDIRNEKVKLFRSIRPIDPREVVRGQYRRGRLNGEEVIGYLEEQGVAPDSTTETFAALRLQIDNWRWSGVPIYLRTGKRMPRRDTEISITFRDAPTNFFREVGVSSLEPNRLTICIQPDETIILYFLAKPPGPDIKVQPVKMDFSYGESFMHEPAEAYERLLLEAMNGDQTLFARGDGVLRCWEVLQPVLENLPRLSHYAAGTWGPLDAFELIAPRRWHVR